MQYKQSMVLLFERHKHHNNNKRYSLNNAKYSDSDTEPEYVTCILFVILVYRKFHCTPWSYCTGSTDTMSVRF